MLEPRPEADPARTPALLAFEADDAPRHPGAFAELSAGRLAAVVLRGAVPPRLLPGFRRRLAALPARPLPARFNEGDGRYRYLGPYALPISAAEPGGPREDEGAFRERLRALFGGGFDYEARLRELLGGLSGGLPVRPAAPEGRGPCLPATIRYLDRGGGLVPHKDEEVWAVRPYRELVQGWTELEGVLGHFVVFRAPEAGGELRLYEQGREDARRAYRRGEGGTPVPLEEGDMVLFDNHRRVHAVTEVRGRRPRGTLGGAAALARGGRGIVYWS